jgi:hypothetical protein
MNEPNQQSGTARSYVKRSATQRAADLVFVEDRILRGMSHAEIAVALSVERGYTVSRQTVTHDSLRLRERWEKQAAESFSTARARELRRLDSVEREAWAAWEGEKATTPSGRSAVPAFLAQILGVHDRRVKLLGLLAPARCEISGPAGAPVQIESAEPTGSLDPKARLELLRRHIARLEESTATPVAP